MSITFIVAIAAFAIFAAVSITAKVILAANRRKTDGTQGYDRRSREQKSTIEMIEKGWREP